MAGRVTLVARRARPILIVDDDPDILAAERQVLAEHGFRVREARDGAEALRAMDEELPAMIVLDVQMPGIDGPTFARQLRMGLRHVPLVIVTGVVDPKREADRCNAEAFLRKPFDAEDLLRLVRRFSS
jgi:CheY-like chemotaxis protein